MNNRNIEIALECFVKKDGKYLMLKRSADKKILPNVWMAPGGKLDFNEGLFACARREMKEETGLDISNIRVLCFGFGHLEDLNLELFFFILEADYAGGELVEHCPEGELQWLTLEEILSLDNLLAELKVTLPKVLINREPVFSYTCVYDKGNQLKELKFDQP